MNSNATMEHCTPVNPSKDGPDFEAEASKTASKKKKKRVQMLQRNIAYQIILVKVVQV